jgi:hypothetical protein
MLWLLHCLDGESSSGESPVPQIRSIGQLLSSRPFSSPNSSVLVERVFVGSKSSVMFVAFLVDDLMCWLPEILIHHSFMLTVLFLDLIFLIMVDTVLIFVLGRVGLGKLLLLLASRVILGSQVLVQDVSTLLPHPPRESATFMHWMRS